MTLLEEVFVQF